jgi:LysR family transcriptional regulator, nitrogen assimilation regulatory protein
MGIMNLKQLQYFTAIYDYKNLSHAASHCNVAQSAISHHLTNLENELGVLLFVRKPRGMEPTAAGSKLFDHAKIILRAVHTAEQDIRMDSTKVEGDIALGLPYSVMKAIGLPLMRAVIKDYPKVRLSLVESLSIGTHANLLSSEVDIALFYNPQKDLRITMARILEEQMLCVGKAEVIGETTKDISFEEVSKFPVLLLREGVSARAIVDRPKLLGRLQARVPVQLNSVNGIVAGLHAGLGCTLAPHVFVSDSLQEGTLNARRIVNPNLSRYLYIGHQKDRPATRLGEAMTDLILKLIRQEVDSGRWQAKMAPD